MEWLIEIRRVVVGLLGSGILQELLGRLGILRLNVVYWLWRHLCCRVHQVLLWLLLMTGKLLSTTRAVVSWCSLCGELLLVKCVHIVWRVLWLQIKQLKSGRGRSWRREIRLSYYLRRHLLSLKSRSLACWLNLYLLRTKKETES